MKLQTFNRKHLIMLNLHHITSKTMRYLFYTIPACCIIGMLACTPKHEGTQVIGKKMMTNILYDYHVAQTLATQSGDSVDFKIRLYTQAVFKKYNITEEEFDNSLRYYHRNVHLLNDIYQPLANRLNETVGKSKETQYTTEGDTANIWSGKDFYIINATGQKYITLELPEDTLLQEGDKMEWSFNTNWLSKDGPRLATAIFSIAYDGDTVTTTHKNVSATGPQQLTLRIIDQKMKSMHVQIMQHADWTTTTKLLLISNIKLVRYHNTTGEANTKRRNKERKANESTAQNDNNNDTIKKEPLKFHFGNTKQ